MVAVYMIILGFFSVLGLLALAIPLLKQPWTPGPKYIVSSGVLMPCWILCIIYGYWVQLNEAQVSIHRGLMLDSVVTSAVWLFYVIGSIRNRDAMETE